MRLPFVMVDVFAERPFEGNRLCVVPDAPPELTTEQMATLALEMNFSESTFVTASRADGYDVRIFTPDAEIPFAGHPTLGTAFVLASGGRTGTDVVQVSAAGEVPVRVDLDAGSATMRQLPPAFGPEVTDRAGIADAAGLTTDDLVADLPAVVATTGLPHVMVPVRDDAALRRAVRRDRTADVCAAVEAESLYLFTVRGDGAVVARMFDRGSEIGEDPATGSAAGPLGAYLAAHGLAGMPGRVVVAQGEMVRRPSFLHVDVEPAGDTWAIDVTGGVRRVGEGVFEL
ncbi:MAG TPA: PhzF family phenazine biosynthesis protein [Actinomycetota bacterium]|nr:PhzF family phenazine biosynthesis protein [Actinomycetota bacterium]